MSRRELDAADIVHPGLRNAYTRCRELNAAHGRTYFLATRLLAPAQRPAVHALYGFARHVDDVVDEPGPGVTNDEVRRRIDELGTVYPELRDARALHAEHVLAADCPLFAPGAFGTRPAVTNADPALVVAGDLARVDLPVALMERAATSGFLAANALLGTWGVRGHDLWSVPNEGRSPLLRHAARRAHHR